MFYCSLFIVNTIFHEIQVACRFILSAASNYGFLLYLRFEFYSSSYNQKWKVLFFWTSFLSDYFSGIVSIFNLEEGKLFSNVMSCDRRRKYYWLSTQCIFYPMAEMANNWRLHNFTDRSQRFSWFIPIVKSRFIGKKRTTYN